jgi:uncharacterized phage-associated protein
MDFRKVVQALAYLASKQPDHMIDAWKAYKLLWIADRYHLRQYGRMITGDTYHALPHGPVPSDAKNIIDGQPLSYMTAIDGYVEKYLRKDSLRARSYHSTDEQDLRVFSKTDLDALDRVLELYGAWDCKQLEEFSHQYPDWKKYEKGIQTEGKKASYPIDVKLFFTNPQHDECPLFNTDEPELLALTKDMYLQTHRA